VDQLLEIRYEHNVVARVLTAIGVDMIALFVTSKESLILIQVLVFVQQISNGMEQIV
jgi:hypothetical protein